MPIEQAVEYVAGAYLVAGGLLVAYLGLMAAKVTRMRQDIAALGELLEAHER